MLRPLAAGLLVSAFCPALAFPRQQELPHEELARDALERWGRPGASPEVLDLTETFREGSVHVRVGLYEVYLSRQSAEDKDSAEHMARVVRALVAAQEAWLDWLEPIAEHRDARKDLKKVAAWAKGLRGGSIQVVAKKGGGELLEALSARDSDLEAAERFATFMGTGACLGMEREDRPEPIVLAADRREFLELVSLAGWIYPDLRYVYWQPQVVSWTNTYVDDYKFIALEYAAPTGGGHWDAGTSMDSHTEDGLAQQVTQLGVNSLVDSYYGDRIPPSLAGALAVNLTIDVFGTCDTRVDGDLRSRRTEAFEVFVPGGRSEGGWLPARAADSRWREHKGADHFLQVLKAAQKNGAQKVPRAEGELRHFEIENDGKNERMVVSGPFLGSPAEDEETPPAAFVGDYKEFLRAYRSCFVHWLRNESVGREKKSREAFAGWLTLLAESEDEELESSVEEVFAKPLSHDELEDQEVLEGQFLDWLESAR